jgi:hypothetical protein
MARFYEAMRAVIEEHDGRLSKFIGDAVVAVFGTPVVREDDALRAVRAAAAMASGLERLSDELEPKFGVRLSIRIGVNTGELVISQGTRDRGIEDSEIVVGDVMNTAARLQQVAGAGEVLIGEETRRLVRHAVALESVPSLRLKGKSQGVRAWRLISAQHPSDSEEAPGETPLIGRQAELAHLHAALEGAIQARACRLVTVIGSPGVGKTRLAQELAGAVGQEVSVVEGHCEPSGEGITLLPVAEVLRSLAGIGEADPPETVREKLAALVEADSERERLVEPLAGVLGVASPASAQETFWALRRGLELVAAQRPILIVLEDLHWGQPMFLDLIEHLIEWVTEAPVLLLALARPELREVREALAFAGRRTADVIELSPLDEKQSRALVSGLLGGAELPEALSERILNSSEGNPLFLAEMLRMLIDGGVLRRQRHGWVAGAEPSSIEVPPTIHALLTARIERLATDERSVVERAAVIGTEFYRGAVAELLAPPVRPRIDGHLEALRRKDVVEPEGTYWIDEPVYRFHHALIRDAAYRSLLKETRAELHERFADWLQEKAGDLVGEHEEVIAFHLEQAHAYRRELGPLDAHGRALGARAAERLYSAGRRALSREDLAAAANLLERSLQREAASEQKILWGLCEALLSAGDTTRAVAFVKRFAIAAGEDPHQSARACVLENQLSNLGGDEHAAASAASAAAAAKALAELGDREGEAKAWQVAASAYMRLGQIGAVEKALDRALLAARAADDKRRMTAVLTGAPRASLWGPTPVVRASGRCLDVVRILRMTPGNRHVEAIALRCQAVLEAMRGRPEAAREILATGRATLEELGLTLELQESAVHAGMVELLAGDRQAAVRLLRGAREGFASLGVSSGAAQAAAVLARALNEQGDHDDEAIEQTHFAERHAGEDLTTTIIWRSARAQALARCDEVEQAIELARSAVALAEPTDALADKADAAMALAAVLDAAGLDEEAREAATAARELYEAKGHTVGASRAKRLIAVGAAQRSAATARAATPQGEEPAPARSPTPDGRPDAGTERPPIAVLSEFALRYNAHDLEGIGELEAEDWVLIDHRALGWEPIRGRDAVAKVHRAYFATSPNVRIETGEVLACDDRVIALHVIWRGQGVKAGELAYPVGQVNVVENGRWVSTDLYESDDRQAMIGRYAELGGGLSKLGSRAPEHWWRDYGRLFAVRDLEAFRMLFAEDARFVDHRKPGWKAGGRTAALEQLEATWAGKADARFEVDEVLACDERVIALRANWQGTTEAAAPGVRFALPVGLVAVIESGSLVSWDRYEPEDSEATLARYAELGGGPSSTAVPRQTSETLSTEATWR